MATPFAYQDGFAVMTWYEPHGVTGHIVPWNYPMQIIGRSVGAARSPWVMPCVAENPARIASLTALVLGEARHRGGAARRRASTSSRAMARKRGAALAAHPGVAHISFTGSVATGALVQTRPPGATSFAVTLELGGKIAAASSSLTPISRRPALPSCAAADPECRSDLPPPARAVLIERPISTASPDLIAGRFKAPAR